ncbi:MAG: hypothetical protein JRI33_07915 [Deltaproteobacteria bacterium]|nr:hypothetical protein [Deltaproteobacteria bacterium]
MLEKVRYADYYNGINVESFTDGYAYDEYSCLYLLSVAGRDASVKAITSALVSGRRIEIMSDEIIDVGTSFGQKYRILSTKLPDALLHQLVLAEGFFRSSDGRENLLYVDRKDDAARLVYDTVRNGYPVPVIPEWSEWLYERLRQEDYVEELLGTRQVLKLCLDEESLDAMVSDGVKNGEISF